MAKYRITQIISSNGETKRQKENLRSLGVRRMHRTVEVEKTVRWPRSPISAK